MGTTLWLWVFWRAKQDGGHLLVSLPRFHLPPIAFCLTLFRASILGITTMTITTLIMVTCACFAVAAVA